MEAGTGRAKEGLELWHVLMTPAVAGYQNSSISICSFSQNRDSRLTEVVQSGDTDCCQLFCGSKRANRQSEQLRRCDEDFSTSWRPHPLQHCKESWPGCLDVCILVPECRRDHWGTHIWVPESVTTDKLNQF